MKKIIILILFITLWASFTKVSGQTSKINFKNIEISGNISQIQFNVTKVLEEPDKEILISKMIHKSDGKIHHVKISGNSILLKTENGISAEFVRNFILKANMDFSLNSIEVKDEILSKEIQSHNK